MFLLFFLGVRVVGLMVTTVNFCFCSLYFQVLIFQVCHASPYFSPFFFGGSRGGHSEGLHW